MIKVLKLEPPIEVTVGRHQWKLTHEEAQELRRKLGNALYSRAEGEEHRLKEMVCLAFDVSMSELMSKIRPARIAHPRQACMWLARKAGFTYTAIGGFFGLDHGTAIHGYEATESRIQTSKQWRTAMQTLHQQCVAENIIKHTILEAKNGTYH